MSYPEGLSLEVINVDDEYYSVKIGGKPEGENTIMYEMFSNCMSGIAGFTDEEVVEAWDVIHETGYMVEDYDYKGVVITYVPSVELSRGRSNLRVDLKIRIK